MTRHIPEPPCGAVRRPAAAGIILLALLLPVRAPAQTVTIPATGKASVSDATVSFPGNLVIDGTLNANNSLIRVAGNWTDNGTFAPGNGTVVFDGTATQEYDNSAADAFNNLTINKSSGSVSLNDDMPVNGILTLTAGLLDVDVSRLLLGPSATVAGTPSSSNMIVTDNGGVVVKSFSGPGSFTFPVGDGYGTPEYSPTTLILSGGTYASGWVSATCRNEKLSWNASVNHYLNRWWKIESGGISGFTCNASFQYTDADIAGTETSIYCGRYEEATAVWTLLNPANAGLNTLSGTVTAFGHFTGGEQGVVPVELTSFHARAVGSDIELRWRTATETNNHGFAVERRHPGRDTAWIDIAFIPGHGTSNVPRDYRHLDAGLEPGVYQYRLRQIDRDGSTRFSAIAEASIALPGSTTLYPPFPNPASAVAEVRYHLPERSEVVLRVRDMLGRDVALLVDGVADKGPHAARLRTDHLPVGPYVIVLETPRRVLTTMLTVRR